MKKNAGKDLPREFRTRKKRQIYAVCITLFLMFTGLWKMRHPGLFLGVLSEDTVSVSLIVLIALFVLFSRYNWRCPGCGKYLGSNIQQKRCRKCGIPLV